MKTPRTRPPNALDERTAVQLAELFDVFSDPSRVRIISVLIGGEQNTGALAEAVGLSQSAISHQMRGLRQLRLVLARNDGRQGLLFPGRPRGPSVPLWVGSHSPWLACLPSLDVHSGWRYCALVS